MEFSDVTIVLIGVVVIGIISLYFGKDDMAMAIIGGLLGFLAKDHVPNTRYNSPVKEYEEGLNQEYNTGDDDGT